MLMASSMGFLTVPMYTNSWELTVFCCEGSQCIVTPAPLHTIMDLFAQPISKFVHARP